MEYRGLWEGACVGQGGGRSETASWPSVAQAPVKGTVHLFPQHVQHGPPHLRQERGAQTSLVVAAEPRFHARLPLVSLIIRARQGTRASLSLGLFIKFCDLIAPRWLLSQRKEFLR